MFTQNDNVLLAIAKLKRLEIVDTEGELNIFLSKEVFDSLPNEHKDIVRRLVEENDDGSYNITIKK